jgi:tRNA(Ile)-lysidine synthase
MEFIRRHELFARAQGILLAVSGGADSTALLHILQSLRAGKFIDAQLVCAHINHKLRGTQSDGDEQLVIEQATELGLAVVTRAVDVRAYAHAHRLSIETAARQLRITSLREIADQHGCAWIATGHQKNDNAETVIHRLSRGTGLRGLAGIRPGRRFDDGAWFASPLLCLTRDEVTTYLAKRRRRWREDHTNVDLAHTRNYIRHRLLPVLQQEARGSIVEELSELAAAAGKLYDRIRREAEEARSKLVRHADAQAVVVASGLASLFEPVAIELIRQVLADLGCGERNLMRQHYRGILELARQHLRGKAVSLPTGFVARREGDRIVCSVPVRAYERTPYGVTTNSAVLQIPGRTRFAGYEIDVRILERHEAEPVEIKGGKRGSIEYLDLDRVRPPVIVRLRRPGDRFRPLGMAGEKKVGKFLTTAKVPREVRERIVIFADQEKILWVYPIRIGEQAKVTDATQRILALTVGGPQP